MLRTCWTISPSAEIAAMRVVICGGPVVDSQTSFKMDLKKQEFFKEKAIMLLRAIPLGFDGFRWVRLHWDQFRPTRRRHPRGG